MIQCQDDSSFAESFPSHGYCVHLKYYTNLLHLILMDKVSIINKTVTQYEKIHHAHKTFACKCN